MSTPHRSEEELFAAALELPAASREAFLRDACLGDASFLARVDRLLKAHAAVGGYLEPVLDVGAIGADGDELDRVEERTVGRIGRYKLLERMEKVGGWRNRRSRSAVASR